MARNYAKALLKQLGRALQQKQRGKAESLVGRRVERDGKRSLVESVDAARDRVTIRTENGGRTEHRLSSFLSKHVEVL